MSKAAQQRSTAEQRPIVSHLPLYLVLLCEYYSYVGYSYKLIIAVPAFSQIFLKDERWFIVRKLIRVEFRGLITASLKDLGT